MTSRIQRKRTRGWRRLITGAYVGRPTKWGNPYKVGRSKHTAEEAVMLFRRDPLAGSLDHFVHDRGCSLGTQRHGFDVLVQTWSSM
jgi:hypothetical protein